MLHVDQNKVEWSIDGSDKNYPKLETGHLKNIIAFIKRNAKKHAQEYEGTVFTGKLFQAYSYLGDAPDGAALSIEQGIREYEKNGESYETLYSEFCERCNLSLYEEELKKRKEKSSNIKVCHICGRVDVSQHHLDHCMDIGRIDREDNLWK